MLGRTAEGLFWMARYLERSENTARMLHAGLRMALTRSTTVDNEWSSVISAIGDSSEFSELYESYQAANVINYVLRDPRNPSSILGMMELARNNARAVRTALTREVWEAINESWLIVKDLLGRPVRERDLPEAIVTVQRQCALVRGAMLGTMLRNDIYNFTRIGTFLERADNTARILDVKYYVLLPSSLLIGSSLDNVQWETILRSLSAHRSYRWLSGGDISAPGIAEFLILDPHMPRSLAFCQTKVTENLNYLSKDYGDERPSLAAATSVSQGLATKSIQQIVEKGLHEFLQSFLRENARLAQHIEADYRFRE